jgi:hypothetical protein
MLRTRRSRWLLAASLLAVFVVSSGAGALVAHETAPPTASRSSSSPSSGSAGAPLASVPAPAVDGASELTIAAARLDMVVHSTFKIDPDGSIGTNHSGWHSLGFQRPFGNDAEVALIKQDPRALSLAVTALEYSYQHQNPDGSFQVTQVPGAAYQLNTDPVVGVVFWYGDLGHVLQLLTDSQWYRTSPETAAIRARVDALRSKIALTLRWLSAPTQLKVVQNTGNQDTNRATFGAEGFLLTGEWLDDPAVIAIGTGLLHKAEANLQPDGAILEKGGFDSGYQSVSLDNLLHLYMHLNGNLASLKPALWTMINRGMSREKQAIGPTGQLSHANNTRTYCGGESFRGKQKQGGGNAVVRDLVFYSALTNDASLVSTANSVVQFYAGNPHDLCALPQ